MRPWWKHSEAVFRPFPLGVASDGLLAIQLSPSVSNGRERQLRKRLAGTDRYVVESFLHFALEFPVVHRDSAVVKLGI